MSNVSSGSVSWFWRRAKRNAPTRKTSSAPPARLNWEPAKDLMESTSEDSVTRAKSEEMKSQCFSGFG